jgi:hypothetical protein
MGVAIVLHTLGFAVGGSAINPANPQVRSGGAIALGIWVLLVPIISLFFGGWVAGRAGRFTRMNAGLHGAVVWAVYQLIALVLFILLLTGALLGIAGAASPQFGGRLMSSLFGTGVAALWGSFISMILSLVLAIVGSVSGVRRRERRESRLAVPVQRPAESRV